MRRATGARTIADSSAPSGGERSVAPRRRTEDLLFGRRYIRCPRRTSVESDTTTVLGLELPMSPLLAAAAALVALVALSFLLEFVLLRPLRRAAERTATKLDDAVVAGLSPIVRTGLLLAAVDVVAQLFLKEPWRPNERRMELAVAVVVVSWQAWRLLIRVSVAWVDCHPELKRLVPSFRLGLQIVLVPVVVVTVLQIFDVPVLPLATTLGIGGLAIGLALQDVLKNIFAGIQILLDQPIRVGEWVDLEHGLSGRVTAIGMRSTRLQTAENNTIFIPNARIASEAIVNWDATERDFLVRLKVRVALGTDSTRVRRILEEEVDAAIGAVVGVKARQRVVLDQIEESRLEFRVEFLVERAQRLVAPGLVRERLHARLARERIDLLPPPVPFPVTLQAALPGRDVTRALRAVASRATPGGDGPGSASPGGRDR